MSSWRRAYANQAAGIEQAHILCLGDSITQKGVSNPWSQYSYPALLSASLAALTGVTPGTGIVQPSEVGLSTETRMTTSGTWSNAGSGPQSYARSTTTGTLTFTATCRYFVVHFSEWTNTGDWSYTIDGGGSVASGGVAGPPHDAKSLTIDCGTDASHVLVLTGPAGGTLRMIINGIDAIRNPTSGVRVSNVSKSGGTTTGLQAPNYQVSSYPTIMTWDVDLVTLMIGTNDSLDVYGGTTQFATAYDALVAPFYRRGIDMILITPPPPQASSVSTVKWTAYCDIIRSTAELYGCGLCDVTASWGTREADTSKYADSIHPSQTGIGLIRDLLFTEVKRMAGV